MTTTREDIIGALTTALASTAGVSGRVFRGRPYPAGLTELPCIFVSWVYDRANYSNNFSMDWTLSITLTVLVRGEAPDVLADPIIKSAHALLMADRSIGGRVLDILPSEHKMDIIEGDNPVGLLQAIYNIQYRTNQESLD